MGRSWEKSGGDSVSCETSLGKASGGEQRGVLCPECLVGEHCSRIHCRILLRYVTFVNAVHLFSDAKMCCIL